MSNDRYQEISDALEILANGHFIAPFDTDTIRELLAERDQLAAALEAARVEVDALREALEEIRSRSTMNLAMQPDLFALAANLGYIYQVADAAIDRARGKAGQEVGDA